MRAVFVAEQFGLQYQDKLKEIEERLSLIEIRNKKLYTILSKPELSSEDRCLIQKYLKEYLTECISRTNQLDDSNPNKPKLNNIGKRLMELSTALVLITQPLVFKTASEITAKLIEIYFVETITTSTKTEPQQVEVKVEFNIESLNISINDVQDIIKVID